MKNEKQLDGEDTKQSKSTGNSAKVKSAAEFIKSIGIFVTLAWAILTFVAVILWEARVEPWLVERVKVRLEETKHEDWIRHQVLLSLTNNRSTYAEQLEQEYRDRPIIEQFVKPVQAEDVASLFQNSDFQVFFLKEILLAVSNHDEERVDEIIQNYADKNLLEAWLDPPSVSALAGWVTEQVDALYTHELYYTREARWENGRPVRDDNGEQVFVTRSQVSDRFYANSDQRITIEVDPNLTGRFREAFNEGTALLYLEIGSTYRTPIPRNGLKEEVTCEVRDQLRGKPAGFVSIRANTESGEIPEGGYELDVIITARKGGVSCD